MLMFTLDRSSRMDARVSSVILESFLVRAVLRLMEESMARNAAASGRTGSRFSERRVARAALARRSSSARASASARSRSSLAVSAAARAADASARSASRFWNAHDWSFVASASASSLKGRVAEAVGAPPRDPRPPRPRRSTPVPPPPLSPPPRPRPPRPPRPGAILAARAPEGVARSRAERALRCSRSVVRRMMPTDRTVLQCC